MKLPHFIPQEPPCTQVYKSHLTSLPLRDVCSFLSPASSSGWCCSLLLTFTVVTPAADSELLALFGRTRRSARDAEGSKPSIGNCTTLFDFTQWPFTNWNRFKWIIYSRKQHNVRNVWLLPASKRKEKLNCSGINRLVLFLLPNTEAILLICCEYYQNRWKTPDIQFLDR